MNRKQLIYALSAVGVASGFATLGRASTTTIYPDISFDSNDTTITLPGVSAAPFTYEYYSTNFGKMLRGNQVFEAGAGESLSDPNVTGPWASQTYDNSEVYTYESNFP